MSGGGELVSVLVRLPARLHGRIVRSARRAGVSRNRELIVRLEGSFGEVRERELIVAVVRETLRRIAMEREIGFGYLTTAVAMDRRREGKEAADG
jgi:hypothetical protein